MPTGLLQPPKVMQAAMCYSMSYPASYTCHPADDARASQPILRLSALQAHVMEPKPSAKSVQATCAESGSDTFSGQTPAELLQGVTQACCDENKWRCCHLPEVLPAAWMQQRVPK